jgi:hypothetical protein
VQTFVTKEVKDIKFQVYELAETGSEPSGLG